jgi:hypothetical protein
MNNHAAWKTTIIWVSWLTLSGTPMWLFAEEKCGGSRSDWADDDVATYLITYEDGEMALAELTGGLGATYTSRLYGRQLAGAYFLYPSNFLGIVVGLDLQNCPRGGCLGPKPDPSAGGGTSIKLGMKFSEPVCSFGGTSVTSAKTLISIRYQTEGADAGVVGNAVRLSPYAPHQ